MAPSSGGAVGAERKRMMDLAAMEAATSSTQLTLPVSYRKFRGVAPRNYVLKAMLEGEHASIEDFLERLNEDASAVVGSAVLVDELFRVREALVLLWTEQLTKRCDGDPPWVERLQAMGHFPSTTLWFADGDFGLAPAEAYRDASVQQQRGSREQVAAALPPSGGRPGAGADAELVTQPAAGEIEEDAELAGPPGVEATNHGDAALPWQPAARCSSVRAPTREPRKIKEDPWKDKEPPSPASPCLLGNMFSKTGPFGAPSESSSPCRHGLGAAALGLCQCQSPASCEPAGVDFLGGPLGATAQGGSAIEQSCGTDFLGGPIWTVPQAHAYPSASVDHVQPVQQSLPSSATPAAGPGRRASAGEPMLCVCHDWKRGCRLGEASHPGPGFNLDLGNLGDSLGDSIMKSIKEQIQKAVDEAVKQALASLNLGRGLAAARPSGDPDVQLEPKGRRKRKRKAKQATSHPGGNPDVSGGERAGGRQSAAKGKGKPEDKSGPAKVAQRGGPGDSGQRRGKGKGGCGEAGGQEAGDGWQIVRRKAPEGAFKLRKSDWDAPVVEYAALAEFIDKADASKVLELVVFVSADQDEEAQRIPGTIGDRLVFRTAKVQKLTSAGASGHAQTSIKIKPTESAVVYFKVPKQFASADTWKAFGGNASKAAVDWVAAQRIKVLDTFAWVLEKQRNDTHEQYFGIVRIPKADIEGILAHSGKDGVFVDAARTSGPRAKLQWIEKLPGEKVDAYFERALRQASSLGLVVNGGRLAWRSAMAAGEATVRIWHIDGVPHEWDVDAVGQLLATRFTEYTILSHRRTRLGSCFRFRGQPATADTDLVPFVVEHQEKPLSLWATLAPFRVVSKKQKPLASKAVPVVALEQPVVATIVKPPTGELATGEDGKEVPQQKRVKQEVRTKPGDLQLKACPRDGACVLHALSLGLQWLGDSRPNHPRMLRAQMVEHMRRHVTQYDKEWDGKGPDSEPVKDRDFSAYLTLMEKEGAYCSDVELRALGRVLDIKIVVLPAGLNFSPYAFHSKAAKMLVLWYEDNHVDLMLPPEGHKKYPSEYAQITAGPVFGLRAGGRGPPSVFTASSAACVRSQPSSQWTSVMDGEGAKSQARPASVWTTSIPASASGSAAGRPSIEAQPSLQGRRPRSQVSQARSSGSRVPSQAKVQALSRPGPLSARCKAKALHGSQTKPRGEPQARSSQATAQARPSGTKRKAVELCTSSVFTCTSTGTIEAFDESEFERARVPPKRCPWLAHATAPADLTFRCNLCPYKRKATSNHQYYHIRHNHYQRAHEGQGLQPDIGRPKLTRVCGPRAQFIWCCPFCNKGITHETRKDLSRFSYYALRNQHRAQAHPEVSKAEWQRLAALPQTGPKDRQVHAKGCRQRNLTKAVFAQVRPPRFGDQMQLFVWPRARCEKRSTRVKHVLLEHGWKCLRCGECTRDLAAAKQHSEGTPCCRGCQACHLHANPLLAVFIKLLSINANRTAISKVDLCADFLQSCGAELLSLQEADINPLLAQGFGERWHAHGYRAVLSDIDAAKGVHRVALVASLPMHRVNLKLPPHVAARCAAGAFEMQAAGSKCITLVVAFYGFPGQPAATAQALGEVRRAAATFGGPYILLGDFNVDQSEQAVVQLLCDGELRSLDEADWTQAGPTNPTRTRRIDFGLAHWSIIATAVKQFERPDLSDHGCVFYETRCLSRADSFSMPKFRELPATATEDILSNFGRVWDAAHFESSIAGGALDEAWAFLSDVAERTLGATSLFDASGARRSDHWLPCARPESHHRVGPQGHESQSLRSSRKLLGQLHQLRQQPHCQKLWRAVGRRAGLLRATFPDLPVIHAANLAGATQVISHLHAELQQQETEARVHRWRRRVEEDPSRALAWVKRKADHQLAMEQSPQAPAVVLGRPLCSGPLFPRATPSQDLVDHYKWQGVHSCGRIRNRGHRDDATLPVPGSPLRSARFALEGHRLAVAAEPTREVRLAALGSGGSIWYHCKRLEMSSPDTTACAGLLQPASASPWCLDFENTLQSIVALRTCATVVSSLRLLCSPAPLLLFFSALLFGLTTDNQRRYWNSASSKLDNTVGAVGAERKRMMDLVAMEDEDASAVVGSACLWMSSFVNVKPSFFSGDGTFPSTTLWFADGDFGLAPAEAYRDANVQQQRGSRGKWQLGCRLLVGDLEDAGLAGLSEVEATNHGDVGSVIEQSCGTDFLGGPILVPVWIMCSLCSNPFSVRVGEAKHPGRRAPAGEPMLCVCHDWKRGCRLGEASHPGPGFNLDLGNLGDSLGDSIMKSIKEQIQKAVDEAIKQALASLNLGGGLAAARLSGDPDVQLEPKGRRKRKRKAKQATSHPGGNPDVSGGERAGGRQSAAKGKGKPGDKSGPAKVAQRGGPGDSGQRRGKGKGGCGEAGGQEAGDGWQIVRRKAPEGAFTLRKSDWDAPVVEYAALAEFIDKADASKVLELVVFVSADQVTLATNILRGSGLSFKALLVFLSKDEEAQRIRAPLGIAWSSGLLRSRSSRLQVPVAMLRSPPVPKQFASADTWKAFGGNASKAAVDWVAAQRIKVLDTFAWVLEKQRNDTHEQYFGIVRIPKADIEGILAHSGKDGVFVDAARTSGPRAKLQWIEKLPGEKVDAYFERALRQASSLGLVVNGGRLAWRSAMAAGEATVRIWHIDGVPHEWDVDAVGQLLATRFTEYTILSHRRTRLGSCFRFRGQPATADTDLVPFVVEHQEKPLSLWATLAPFRVVSKKQKPLASKAVPVVALEQPVAATIVKPPTGELATGEDGKEVPQQKRVKQEVRTKPGDLQLKACPRDGACVLHALSLGLQWLGDSRPNHPRMLRAQMVEHMRRHATQYEKEWDGKGPDSEPVKDRDFPAYLTLMEKEGAYCSDVELRALGRVLDIKIVVLPAGLNFSPYAFHSKAAKMLVLWYEDNHVDLMLPPEGHKKYPSDYPQITAGPVFGLRAGGRGPPSVFTAPLLPVFDPSHPLSGPRSWKAKGQNPRLARHPSGERLGECCGAALDRSPALFARCKAKALHGPQTRPRGEPQARSSQATAQARPSGTKRKAVELCTSSVFTCTSAGTIEAFDESEFERARVPPKRCPWLAHATAPADLTFRCNLCPYKRKATSNHQYYHIRHNHYQRAHEGQGLQADIGRPKLTRVCGPRAQFIWCCPFCNKGITHETRKDLSRFSYYALRNQHRAQAHPEVSKAEWQRLTALPQTGPKDRQVHAKGCRQRNLTKAVFAQVRTPRFGDQMQLFVWPRARCENRSTRVKHVLLEHGWKCLRCGECTRDLAAAKQHSEGRCKSQSNTQKRIQKLDAIEAWARRAGGDPDFCSQVLRAAEADINPLSAQGFGERWRAHGYRAVLSDIDAAKGAFEMQAAGSKCITLVVAFYGFPGQPAATAQALGEVRRAAATFGGPYILLGDFNVDQSEQAVVQLLCDGELRSLDEADWTQAGPTNPTRTRRIDFGLAHWSIIATAVKQFERPHLSDHGCVFYETRCLSRADSFSMPKFRELPATATEDILSNFGRVWDAAHFESSIAGGALDEAWAFLSDVAERTLGATSLFDASGARRSDHWLPCARHESHHRVGPQGHESQSLRSSRKLLGQLHQLRQQPHCQKLWRAVGRRAGLLRATFPDLPVIHAANLAGATQVISHLHAELQQQETEARVHRWRCRVEEDPSRALAWVKRKADHQLAMEQSPQAHAGVPSSVHPASIVEEHGKVWLQHWKPESPVNFDAVQRILDRVPGGPQSDIVLQVEAEALMRATKAMLRKAMGPDRWSAELLLRLPVPWWEAAATLWNAVLSTKYVPRLWRRALIALVPKRLDEYRPIALCPVIWRAGAHCISRNVLPWMDTWLGHHTLGGAPCRGPGDAHARLFHAWQSGGKVFCQQDLTRFFDSLDVQAVGMVLRHLGAPAGLAELLASFYQDASRLFLHEGRSSSAWGSPARGLAQGCPLSPMAAVAVGHIWAMWVQSFAKGRTDCLIFIDDRVLWPSCTCADPLGAMDVALRASDSFDQAFGFQCRASKCAVVCPPDVGTFDQWASARSYPRVTTLKVLGITLDMQEGALGLLKFSPRLLLHRLRFLKLLGGEVPQLRRIVLQLVHSAMFWAGGVACPDRDCLRDVWHSTCAVLQKHATFESPKVLLCASFGWSLDPEWAADWASLRAAWRFKARPPAWLDTAGLDVACGDWRRFLPGAAAVVQRLGWQVQGNGAILARLDDSGTLRQCHLGWESFDVVKRWLVDHYKWQGVHSCGRIRNRGHRDDATLARGLSLGAPLRSARFALEGHRLAVAAEPTREVRLAALGSGGSIWYHCKRLEMSSPDTTACVCGLLQPSRAHLTWCCASTTGLRQGLAPPSTRAGERLFAAEITEYPAAPAASDFENILQSIVAHLRNFATVGERLLIATDGSAKFDVGGCAVIFGSGDGTFVFGDACEDQSAFRCELLTLTTLFEAISRAQLAPGCQVGILVDCSSALQAVAQPEACSMPLLAHKAARLLRDVSAGGLDLKLSWTPAHGRRPNWTAPWGLTADRCRDLNERADAAANSIREHRARGSGRVSWHAELHRAALWERGAILASAGASNVLAQNLRARLPARLIHDDPCNCDRHVNMWRIASRKTSRHPVTRPTTAGLLASTDNGFLMNFQAQKWASDLATCLCLPMKKKEWQASRLTPLVDSGTRSQASAAITVINWNCGGFSTLKDEFYTWLRGCDCDVVCLQETWMKECSEFFAGDWLCVQSGMNATSSRAQAGVMIMLRRSVFDNGSVRYSHVMEGRLLHVRAQHKHGWVDVVGAYLHAWGGWSNEADILAKRSKVWAALRQTLGQLPRGNQLVVCGDFNTVVQPKAPFFGTGMSSNNPTPSADAQDFEAILHDFGLQAVNTFGKQGSYTHILEHHSQKTRSFLDYVLVRRKGPTLSSSARMLVTFPVARWRGGGRHLPVLVTVRFRRFQFARPRPQPAWPQWKCKLLADRIAADGPDVQDFKAQVSRELQAMHDFCPDRVNQVLMKASRDHFHIVSWPDNNFRNVLQVFELAFGLGGAEPGFTSCTKSYVVTAGSFADIALMNFYGMRHVPKQPKARAQLRSSTGAILMPQAEVQALASYWKEVTTAEDPVQAPSATTFDLEMDAVQQALASLPSNKAAPAHYAPHALWSCVAEPVSQVLERGLLQEWRSSGAHIPTAWADAWLTFLQKANKAGNKPEHLRPIALLDPVGKAVSGLLRKQLDTYILPHMEARHQYGFLPGRSVQQALGHAFIHCKSVRSLSQAQNRSLYDKFAGHQAKGCAGGMLLSIDLTQAFDRVGRDLLEQALIHIGVPLSLRSLLLRWVHSVRYVVQKEGHAQTFPTSRGIRQGCRLSPSLWNCVVVYLTHLLEQQLGVDWCRQRLIGYADDNLFKWTFHSREDVAAAISEATAIINLLEQQGLTVSKDKTAILLKLAGPQAEAYRRKIVVKHEGKHHLRLNQDLTLPVKAQHTYLGAIISFGRFEELNATHRCQAGIATYNRLRQHLHSKRTWPLAKRLRLWKAYVLPTVFYSLTASGLTEKGASCIRVALLRQLRAIAGRPRHLTLESDAQFLLNLGMPTPLQLLIDRQRNTLDRTEQLRAKLSPGDFRLDAALLAHETEVLHGLQELAADSSNTGATDDLPCPDCGERFPTAASLRQHRAKVHRSGENKAKGESFDRLLHGKDGLPQCINCGHKFGTWEELQRHVQLGRCQAPERAGYDDVHPPLLAKVLADEIVFPEVMLNPPNDDLKKELLERCALCRQWLPNENYMKVHYGRVHKDEWKAHSSRLRVWCTNNLAPIKGTCQWCGHKAQQGRDHRATCPALFQLAMSWFVNGGPKDAADMTAPSDEPYPSAEEVKPMLGMTYDAEIQDVFANCLPALANLKAGSLEEVPERETEDLDMPNRGKRSRQEPMGDKTLHRSQLGKGKGGQRGSDAKNRGSWNNWERDDWDYHSWRPQHRADLERLMEALCRLTLKQEEELQLLRTEKQFLLHLESGPQGMLSPLWKVAQVWKAGKDKTPPTVTSSLRVALIKCVLAEWMARLDIMTKDAETVKKMEAQGWVKVQGVDELHWNFQQWNQQTRQLELDPSKPPVGHSTILRAATNLQALVNSETERLIHRFHSTRKLTESVMGDTMPFILSVAMRGTKAQQAHDILSDLTGSAALRTVGVRIRGERVNLQPLAQQIAKMAAALRR
ncbi:unnamed protein product [Symbiodinium sp. CCMP2592]|nr:unnamed protein product [Symbiodinium sp. CCMP2592]